MTRHASPASVSRWKPAEFLCHGHSVQKLLSFVKSTLKRHLMDRKPLPPTWVHPKGHLVLLGNACHPVLVCMSPAAQWNVLTDPPSLSQPYRAQGAAIAVEDAAALGALLSHVSSLSRVPALLQA